MNGVDRADQLRTEYSTYCSSKKWWQYLFWFLVDVSVANSFICMKESPNHIVQSRRGRVLQRTMLQFRQNLAKQLIGEERCERKRKLPPSTDPQGLAHFPRAATKGRCIQCRVRGRRSEPKWVCSGCGVHLCVQCFLPYRQ